MKVENEEIVDLFTNILLYLLNKNKIIIYNSDNGLIVKIDEESSDYLYRK